MLAQAQGKIELIGRTPNARIPADQAQVVLEAHNVFAFGNVGFQMLLDKDHNTYGSVFTSDSYTFDGDYNDFEYKIPADAEADRNTSTTVVDGKDSTLIPAGIYDYMIVSPRQDDGILFVRNKWGRQDDFSFQGGYTYTFLVTRDDNSEETVTPFADIDAAVDSLIIPAKSTDLTASEPVTIRLTNRGTSAIKDFPVSYSINGGEAVTETYSDEIAAGATTNYTFTNRADLSAAPQKYDVKAWSSLQNDLINGNDTATASTKHIAPLPLPFTETFASADDLASDWTIIGTSSSNWEFNQWETYPDGDGSGSVMCSSWLAPDSWLISSPIILGAGDNHVKFYAHSAGTVPENLSVYYGTSVDTTAMNLISATTVNSREWRQKIFNFNVPTAGAYYIAFRYQSDGNGASVTIDSVNVDSGKYDVEPNLRVDKVLLPYSNCDLSDASTIGVRLTNIGTGPSSQFNISYSVDGGTAVEQTVNDVLEPEQTKEYYFDKQVDFSDLATFNVGVKVTAGGVTNEGTESVTHYSPVTTLPLTTNFYSGEGIDTMWIPMGDDSWQYEAMGGCYKSQKTGIENGLLSRCITFSTPFRVKMAYGGTNTWSPVSMYVAYGRPGTDPATWQKVYEDDNVTDTKEIEFTVTPESEGEYDLLIVDNSDKDSYVNLSLYQLTISALFNYDQRVIGVDSHLAPYTPLSQAQASGTYDVSVENRGGKSLTNVKATVTETGGHGTITTSTLPTLEAGDTAVVSGSGALTGVKVGDRLDVSVTASSDETDEYEADNTVSLFDSEGVNVTDTVYAFENNNDWTAGTGSYQPINFGLVYRLAVADTLTSVSFGLAQDDYYSPKQIGVAIYKVNDDGITLGHKLFETQMERGAEGGLRTVTFPAKILQPGKYYFEIQQLSNNNIGMSYVMADGARSYQNNNGVLSPVSGAYLVIRANFAHGAVAYAHNAAVTAITSPANASALFTNNETIKAVVENLGSNDEKSIDVTLNVAGQTQTQTISLDAYDKDTVSFTGIDLSVPGDYTIKVTATVAGDGNADDNTFSMPITSRAAVSPYKVDFESCNDFDTDHEFNPRWWTVNRSDYNNDEFWAFNYPHKGEHVGFVAFNVDGLEPLYDDVPLPEGVFPHSGQRFGAAFGITYPAPDGTTADTWFISPKLSLSTNSSLELYVKTHALENAMSKLERYRILISDTNDDFDSFTVFGGDREAPTDWTKVTVDLSQYDNKDVYIAIQYCSTYLENYFMMIDDISVISDNVTGIGGIQKAGNLKVSSYGGVLHITSDSAIGSVSVYDMAGAQVYRNSGITATELSVPTSQWASGVYIARVSAAGSTQTVKFVITK